jgi:hypothetical protein
MMSMGVISNIKRNTETANMEMMLNFEVISYNIYVEES